VAPSRAGTIRVEDMRAIELNAVALGIPLLVLMENAGSAVARVVEERLGGSVAGARIAVLAGKGGNGGDGFVAARHLAGKGARVDVHLAYPPGEVSHPDAKRNLEVLQKLESVRLIPPLHPGWLELEGYRAVIDALLGTGVRGRLRGPIARALEAYNKAQALRVSIDVPSGVNPDTGEASPGAAVSDITVTMHRVKEGLLRAGLYTGEIIEAPIGVPVEAEKWAGPGDVAARIPPRPKDAHKGVGGKVLVIAGSEHYVGAPMLTAIAAARAGADLVYLAAPARIAFEAAAQCSSIIPVPLTADFLTTDDIERLERLAGRVHSIAIGPGLGKNPSTLVAAEKLLETLAGRLPIVIDADALEAIPPGGFQEGTPPILTPHRGEAKRLADPSLSSEEIDPKAAARVISERYGAVALVKGPVDVACLQGQCRENHAGVPAMSVGGTGDVLTGVIAAILARRQSILGRPDPLNTAITGAYLAGSAGELAYEEKGEAMTAWDVVEKLHEALAKARSIQ